VGAEFAAAAATAAHLAQALGWPPDIFWAATPADLRLALGPPPETPGDGSVLARLMKEFPDG
jgi:hypothetical protein